jgi:hypothetical protein
LVGGALIWIGEILNEDVFLGFLYYQEEVFEVKGVDFKFKLKQKSQRLIIKV